MKLVRAYGGKSIAVYNKSKDVANKLIQDGRADFMAEADYTEGSEMEQLVKMIIDHMKCDEALKQKGASYHE